MFNSVIDAKYVSVDGSTFIPCEFTAQFKSELQKTARSSSVHQCSAMIALNAYPNSFTFDECMSIAKEGKAVRFGQLVTLTTLSGEVTLIFRQ